MNLLVLCRVNGIALNMIKICKDCKRPVFTVIFNLLEKETAHGQMISIKRYFKWIHATLELTAMVLESGHKIITVVQYVLELVLCNSDLKPHFYAMFTFLSTANGTIYIYGL